MSKKTDYKKLWRQSNKAFLAEYNANQILYSLTSKALAFVKANCTKAQYAKLLKELNVKEPNDNRNPVRKQSA